MIVKTRLFELCNDNYKNLSGLAQAMGISVSQVYRVREGKRHINQKFIVGAIKAFPNYKLDELFYLAPESPTVTKEKQLQALGKLTSAIDDYGEHLTSHTSAIINLTEAAQELRKGAEAANKVLGHLIEVSVN